MYLPKRCRLNSSDILEESLLKILVATDCHLGYEESDPIINEDSFITFEEVLQKALDEDVDCILLGGDLFHHNNPSQRTLNRCIELLRQYVLGNQAVKFELLTSGKGVFSHTISQTANYLDENINVSIPVFSIHGNHDDPSGLGHYSSLDTLSSAGLLNYIGKCTDLIEVTIKPVVIRKGNTYLALYGLSYIKDDRLCRLFLDKKNRVDRGTKRFISESYLPSKFDLIVWGHEHDCEVEPMWNIEKEFHVLQPGSTVATSLSEGEAKPKHIGVLHLWEDLFRYKPIKLNTVRPYVWKSISLNDVPMSHGNREGRSEEVKEHCLKEVESMIEEAKQLITGHPKQPKLPLIRLRCEYSDESQLFNIVKFGQQFLNRVATPNYEIIRLKKATDGSGKGERSERAEIVKDLADLYGENAEDNLNFAECVNHIIGNYFEEHLNSKMVLLSVAEMGNATEKFIEKGETGVIDQIVERKLDKLMKEMARHRFENEDEILEELQKLKNTEERSEARQRGNTSEENLCAIASGQSERVTSVESSSSGTDEYDPCDYPGLPSCAKSSETQDHSNATHQAGREKSAASIVDESDSDFDGDAVAGQRGRGIGRQPKRGRGRSSAGKTVETRVGTRSSGRKTTSRSKTENTKPLKFHVTDSIDYDEDSNT